MLFLWETITAYNNVKSLIAVPQNNKKGTHKGFIFPSKAVTDSAVALGTATAIVSAATVKSDMSGRDIKN